MCLVFTARKLVEFKLFTRDGVLETFFTFDKKYKKYELSIGRPMYVHTVEYGPKSNFLSIVFFDLGLSSKTANINFTFVNKNTIFAGLFV